MLLKSIALHEAKVIRDWQKAPLGAILQVTLDAKPLIGMRCGVGVTPYILALDGEQVGNPINSDRIRPFQALDITHLVEIRIKLPSPFPYTQRMTGNKGFVVELNAGPGRFFMEAGSLDGYLVFACLSDSDGIRKGQLEHNMPVQELITIGQIEVVAKGATTLS